MDRAGATRRQAKVRVASPLRGGFPAGRAARRARASIGVVDLSTPDSCESTEVGAQWESVYRRGAQLNLYPYDNVVAWFSARYPDPAPRSAVAVLEVGCGAGNNLWFLARAGFACAGIDISAAAIDFARARLQSEALAADLRVGSFAELPFASQAYDVVLDRGGIACVDLDTARATIAEIARVLRPGGTFLFSPFAEGTRLPADKARLVGCLYDRPRIEQVLPDSQWQIRQWVRTDIGDELHGTWARVLWWIEAERRAA